MVALSQGELPAPLCVVDQYLMGIPVHNQDASVGGGGHAVHIGDLSLRPATQELAARSECHHRRISALPDVHNTIAVDGHVAEKTERLAIGQLRPVPLDGVAAVPQHHDQRLSRHWMHLLPS